MIATGHVRTRYSPDHTQLGSTKAHELEIGSDSETTHEKEWCVKLMTYDISKM